MSVAPAARIRMPRPAARTTILLVICVIPSGARDLGRCAPDPRSLAALGMTKEWSTRLPRPLSDGRNELVQPARRKLERRPMLGALIGRHEDFHNVEAVVERELGLLLAEKHAHEVSVFGLVAVCCRLVRDHRHESHLGVLFLDEVLAGLAMYGAREEELEP